MSIATQTLQETSNTPVTQNAARPTVFIGSSSEALEVARALQFQLQDVATCVIWNEGVFQPGQALLDTILQQAASFDFAVLVLTPDDLVESRGSASQAPRDNVIFELGVFLGQLGRERTFIVASQESDLRILSDLAGISYASFSPTEFLEHQIPSLGPASLQIRKLLKALGSRDHGLASSNTQTDLLIDSFIHAACRSISAPLDPNTTGLRVFVFRKEVDHIVCRHFWSSNPTREIVGNISFALHAELEQSIAVVRAANSRDICRTKISPLPDDLEGVIGKVDPDLRYVLAAPILTPEGDLWGTIDFDTDTEEGENLLATKITDSAMFQIAKHLGQIIKV